jgi:hypothetical protein
MEEGQTVCKYNNYLVEYVHVRRTVVEIPRLRIVSCVQYPYCMLCVHYVSKYFWANTLLVSSSDSKHMRCWIVKFPVTMTAR